MPWKVHSFWSPFWGHTHCLWLSEETDLPTAVAQPRNAQLFGSLCMSVSSYLLRAWLIGFVFGWREPRFRLHISASVFSSTAGWEQDFCALMACIDEAHDESVGNTNNHTPCVWCPGGAEGISELSLPRLAPDFALFWKTLDKSASFKSKGIASLWPDLLHCLMPSYSSS